MGWPFGNPWVLMAAAALDIFVGDPPNRGHPVAAMGWLIAALRNRAPRVAGGRCSPDWASSLWE
jgi:cobalamin biosynthesis protein CobD/CbiB